MHRLVGEAVHEMESYLLSSSISLQPQGNSLVSSGRIHAGGDGKFLSTHTGEKLVGEQVCCWCGVPRRCFGEEMTHSEFGYMTLFDLACRYLTTMWEILLLQVAEVICNISTTTTTAAAVATAATTSSLYRTVRKRPTSGSVVPIRNLAFPCLLRATKISTSHIENTHNSLEESFLSPSYWI